MPVGESMLDMVGNTPVVKLAKVVPSNAADVYVKLEWFNPTGSYKDRMALAMITEAESRGDLTSGMTVVEYTGGSTGSSLAYVCAAKGYRFRVVSSDAFAEEKLKTMRAFGADLTIIESDGGKVTPELTPRMIAKAAEFAAEPGTYWTDQLNNADSLVYQTEKLLRDQGEKFEGDEKADVEGKLTDLKTALEGEEIEDIKDKTEALMTASQAFSQRLYEEAAAQNVDDNPDFSEPTPDDVVDAEIIEDDVEPEADDANDE